MFSKNEYCEWLHDELNTRLNGKKSKVVICGDFNIDLLAPSKHSTELIEIMLSHNLMECSLEEVLSIIPNAENKTSTGVDGISNKLIKYRCSVVSSPSEILFNRCKNLSYFPEQFKIIKNFPIFKEGNKDDFSNYRPISSLPAISRVFERIIFKRVYSYVEKFKLLDDNQFGFRKKETQ